MPSNWWDPNNQNQDQGQGQGEGQGQLSLQGQGQAQAQVAADLNGNLNGNGNGNLNGNGNFNADGNLNGNLNDNVNHNTDSVSVDVSVDASVTPIIGDLCDATAIYLPQNISQEFHAGGTDTGIALENSAVEIVNVEIQGPAVGIRIRGPRTPELEGNAIRDCTQAGIVIEGAVTEWLGHSPEVALRHYARVPDHLFERAAAVAATGDAESDAPATQIPTQTGADPKRPERTRSAEELAGQASGPILSAPVLSRPTDSVTLRGFEPRSQP